MVQMKDWDLLWVFDFVSLVVLWLVACFCVVFFCCGCGCLDEDDDLVTTL